MPHQTILVIEDDVELASTLKTVLEAQGYRVQLASDSEEGMAKVRALRPGLIILDVMMKTTGEGISTAQSLKRDEDLKGIPIIMLTAVQEETGFEFSPEADQEYLPVERFIPKPVDPMVLLEEIRKLMG